jgi:beta-galactosidase
MVIAVNVCAFTRAADVKVRKVERLYKDWKFYKGAPTGTAYTNSYNDASWPAVCVPHAIDTLAPTQTAEAACYSGVAWYRKQITVAGGSNKKYFLDFEGAMQTADVYVNGTSVGRHDNSGYTGFSFDITSQMGTATAAALAVKLDNTKSADIPPGRTDNGPDYFLFSGLYRNVWLVTTGMIYIPFCGQRINTSGGTVQCRTTVKNESTTAANCTVNISIRNKSGAEVATGTATQSVPAAGSSVVAISATVASPQLWSPETPNLYYLYTTVSVAGSVVDDYAATFGFRTLSWSNTNGFSLNGSRYEVKGTCHHQFFAWVQNAVPASRWPIDFAMIKDAGFNAIRCSHYPRDPAFYDAADSVGLLLLVEVPTWCYMQGSFTTGYWDRLCACGREMVTQGYNHPSIFLWGLSNELTSDFPAQVTRMNDTVHFYDTSRSTILANNGWRTHSNIPDVAGLNYMDLTAVPDANMKCISTEYSPSWSFPCVRGASCAGLGNADWGYWNGVANQAPRMAGGFLWVFTDYFALWNKNTPMGIVDEFRLPKEAYYVYRKNFTGKADDNAITGTATKIVLTADVPQLQADGSDFTLVTAALRNSAGACINSTANITFSVTGPVTPLGPTTLAAAAGKIGLILRSTTTTGTITITANSTGLPQASTTVSSVPPFEGNVGVKRPASQPWGHSTGTSDKMRNRIAVYDINGRLRQTSTSLMSSRMPSGVYIVRSERDGVTVFKKMARVAQ